MIIIFICIIILACYFKHFSVHLVLFQLAYRTDAVTRFPNDCACAGMFSQWWARWIPFALRITRAITCCNRTAACSFLRSWRELSSAYRTPCPTDAGFCEHNSNTTPSNSAAQTHKQYSYNYKLTLPCSHLHILLILVFHSYPSSYKHSFIFLKSKPLVNFILRN